jgi:hypothetical protein
MKEVLVSDSAIVNGLVRLQFLLLLSAFAFFLPFVTRNLTSVDYSQTLGIDAHPMSTEQVSNKANMSGTDKNKQPDAGIATGVVKDRTEVAENKAYRLGQQDAQLAMDQSMQHEAVIIALIWYALVHSMFIGASLTWRDCTFLIPLVFTVVLDWALEIGMSIVACYSHSNAILLRELEDTRCQLMAAQRSRIREFQTLRHRENMIRLNDFLARLMILTYFHAIVEKLGKGNELPLPFLVSLAAEPRVHLGETQKMIATAEKIEAVFAQKGAGAEEVSLLETERIHWAEVSLNLLTTTN